MLELNWAQRRVLACVLPHDGKPGFVTWLAADADTHGLRGDQIAFYLQEMGKDGLMQATPDGDGDFTLRLSSQAASYFRERRAYWARTAARLVFELVVGTCGGLVAILAQELLAR